jgi:hypothetical protein
MTAPYESARAWLDQLLTAPTAKTRSTTFPVYLLAHNYRRATGALVDEATMCQALADAGCAVTAASGSWCTDVREMISIDLARAAEACGHVPVRPELSDPAALAAHLRCEAWAKTRQIPKAVRP